MDSSAPVEFRIEDSIAHVILNRPEVGNAINAELVSEFVRIARVCDSNKSVRVVLLTARGKAFCVGGDLKLFASMGDGAEAQLKELADQLHKAISTFSRMDAPLVIAVNGTAAGGGFSLCLTGDYVIAAESAKFSMAYTSAGLSPDGSSTYFLPRLAGMRKAQELMLLNRTLSAQEAAQWGLITRAVPDEKLNDEALAVCRSLARGPRHAQSAVKRLLFCSLQNGIEEQMELEGREIARAAASPEGREGVAAFVAKRRPQF